MNREAKAVSMILGGYMLAFIVSTGFWLMSLTDYPFVRTVGGATLIVGTVMAAIGVAALAVKES